MPACYSSITVQIGNLIFIQIFISKASSHVPSEHTWLITVYITYWNVIHAKLYKKMISN